MAWDPAQYLKFADDRARPAFDLLGRIDLDAPNLIYDLGCGAGNVTRQLRARWPEAEIIGVDGSEAMLAKAAAVAPDITWQQADLGAWRAERPADLIYSNAALHWLDHHETLFPALLDQLAPGGVLAVQIPRNFERRSHTLVTEVALEGPWRAKLEPILRANPTGEPTFYYDILAPRARVDLWQTEYLHVLQGVDPVKEWIKGSWLAPLLDALEEPQRSEMEATYARRVSEFYPVRPDGKTLLPFLRLFFIATLDNA